MKIGSTYYGAGKVASALLLDYQKYMGDEKAKKFEELLWEYLEVEHNMSIGKPGTSVRSLSSNVGYKSTEKNTQALDSQIEILRKMTESGEQLAGINIIRLAKGRSILTQAEFDEMKLRSNAILHE